jgi:hypothetical protein
MAQKIHNCSYDLPDRKHQNSMTEVGARFQGNLADVDNGTPSQTNATPFSMSANKVAVLPVAADKVQPADAPALQTGELETVRDILVGPFATVTAQRLEEFVVILEELQTQMDEREAALEKKIASVQSDLTEREQALNQQIADLSALAAKRDDELQVKIAQVEQDVERRDTDVKRDLSELDAKLDRNDLKIVETGKAFAASLSEARNQNQQKVCDIGSAISSLGEQIALMGSDQPRMNGN